MHEFMKSSISGFASGSAMGIVHIFSNTRGPNPLPLACVFPIHSALFFSTFQMSKLFLGVDPNSTSSSPPSDLVKVAAAATLGELVASIFTYPMENGIEQADAQSIDEKKGSRVVRGAKGLWQQDGWRGFYTGHTVRLFNSVPNAIVLFTTYHHLKSTYNNTLPDWARQGTFLGAASGMLSGLITAPLSNAAGAVHSVLSYGRPVGVKHELTLLCADLSTRSRGGIKKLYRRAIPRILLSSLSASILFTAYELTRSLL